MEISLRTIQALGKIITGDGDISPYRSGPMLVDFFNKHGGNSLYGSGFPSRWQFAEDQIKELNNTNSIPSIIEDAVDPRHFLGTDFDVSSAVEHLNRYLKYDEIKLIKNGSNYKATKTNKSITAPPTFVKSLDTKKGSHAFIIEQNNKCQEKLNAGDYDGAITNARSMVEAVFEEIISQTTQKDITKHDGDLNKLYKEIKKNLNLDPNQPKLSETLKQTLSGLNSIVTGIAGISNKMGDRHARKYKPEKHHALLAINTAYTLCEFLQSSLEYQKSQNKGIKS